MIKITYYDINMSSEPPIMDKIGYVGPIILFVLNIYHYFYRKIYLFSYLLGFGFNVIMNKMIKQTIQEPRPDGSQHIQFMERFHGSEIYGMPSGHAQSVLYSAVFLYDAHTLIFYFSLFISMVTLFQRYKYKRHTLTQLFVGSFIGAIFAFIIYNETQKYAKTKTSPPTNSVI